MDTRADVSCPLPCEALRFCRLAGGEPQLYLNMQAGYDLWHAQQRLATTLKGIKPATKAA